MRWLLLLLLITPAQAAQYAVIDGSNNIVNVIEWDGVQPYDPPTGTHLVPYAPGAVVFKQSTYDGSKFNTPPPLPCQATHTCGQ
jgi:hypothetical protein